MVMSWIFTGILAVSLLCSIYQGNPQALAAAVLQGAQAGVELAVAMAGSLCLWSGVGKLLDAAGIADMLTGLLKPALHRIFPSTATDANLLKTAITISALINVSPAIVFTRIKIIAIMQGKMMSFHVAT